VLKVVLLIHPPVEGAVDGYLLVRFAGTVDAVLAGA
jgi:hypothetical protein